MSGDPFTGAAVTCPVIGHDQALRILRRGLPDRPVLLTGPESVGKWQLAVWSGSYHAPWYNRLQLRRLLVRDAREVRKFIASVPQPSSLGSGVRVVIIDLDGAASEAAQHALLKSLEEPPDHARFILTSSRPPLPTIASRCETLRLGRLTDQQVAVILVSQGLSERDAEVVAPAGHGQVAPALEVATRLRPARAAVLGVVRAISGRDRDLLERSVRDWGDTEQWMLRELLAASASGRPTALFSSMERHLVGKTQARRAIALLAASGSARPTVAVRVVAGALMTERK